MRYFRFGANIVYDVVYNYFEYPDNITTKELMEDCRIHGYEVAESASFSKDIDESEVYSWWTEVTKEEYEENV